ncbi:MAG: SDR family oxidoreductase [Clostridiales Family XIII bacterium]|jgi:NAD(P)-dependent dehydrogenase (short-subunit alcohol dehydrogenase family)|nr:SDR family oxidoreductase [Clostridiales Family XIII bacterium]
MDKGRKNIVITGAAGGLGQAFALSFAKRGAAIAAVDLADCAGTVALVREAGGECVGISADVTKGDSVAAMCARADAELGGIDGLVNNAAIYAGLKMAPFDQIDEKDWDLVFNVNVKGVWLCSKAALPYMKKRGGGSIVNISSASIFEGNPYFAHYVASKGAVWALTRSISRNVGEYGIRANSVTPGYTMTDASKGLAGDPESFKKNYEDNIAARAVKRAMEPTDVVGAVWFLLNDDSAFITGQNINVDGGSIHY